jgi:hypothetical protein
VFRELLVPRRLVGDVVRELADHVGRIRMRREAVLEPHLGCDGGLAEAGHRPLGALDAQDNGAGAPRHGERGDERQARVLAGDRQLDQLEHRRQAVQRHDVGLDDRAGLGGLLGQFSSQRRQVV